MLLVRAVGRVTEGGGSTGASTTLAPHHVPKEELVRKCIRNILGRGDKSKNNAFKDRPHLGETRSRRFSSLKLALLHSEKGKREHV